MSALSFSTAACERVQRVGTRADSVPVATALPAALIMCNAAVSLGMIAERERERDGGKANTERYFKDDSFNGLLMAR